MKKLELKQMENLGGGVYKHRVCSKEGAGMLLGTGGLIFAAATGGVGAVLVAGFGLYLTIDAAANGSCSNW